ncbi:MAG: class I SAM-dependent methyltransferase [Candidatus Dormibacteria bacterium]
MDVPPNTHDPKRLVRRGYDQISRAYRDDRGADNKGYPTWLDRYILPRLSQHARVLDLGCGNGIPATRILSEHFDVTGVDISDVQIDRARRLVPAVTFLRGDIAEIAFPSASFDAVVSFFALIHLPVAEQPGILQRIGDWLHPGGLFLATVGHEALTRTGEFHGAPMYWSHADASTYCAWLAAAGIDVVEREFIPEDAHGGHELIFGQRRP